MKAKRKPAPKKRQKRIAESKGKSLVYQLSQTIDHFFPDLVDRLNEVKDPRARAGLYSIAELAGACIAMFLLKQGSRKAMNDSRYEGRFAKNYRKFFKKLKLPHMDTGDEVMRVLREEELEALKKALVGVLLKKKIFHSSRLSGQYFCVAVDRSGLFSGCPL